MVFLLRLGATIWEVGKELCVASYTFNEAQMGISP